jgi:hexosaminidase
MPHDRAPGLDDERPLMARRMRATLFAAVVSLGMTAANSAELPLLPMPANVTAATGAFNLAHAQIQASGTGERAAAERLRTLLTRSRGPNLGYAHRGQIHFHRDSQIVGGEAYRIVVTQRGVDVTASTDAGLYYGAETLWQLMASSLSEKRIPALTIDDRPAFAWRGVMLDSARHMQPVSYVKQLIDRMAMSKLNLLHWHLSDDQGWRIEIDRYPRLTSVGAWRQEAGAAGVDPRTGKPILYGGYYNKAQIREVVAFARSRHVTVVPEIDMPGHATAIVAAYPQLASIPKPPASPSHDWGILPNLLNADDATFTFIDNVLDEVMALFPGPFIHVGGDEAVKDQWKANPAIQAKINMLALKDEDALQGWFTARVGDYLAKHGRRLIGWDEILGGKVPANAAVMSWHGIDGAITAAKSGHDAVLAASPILYLDHLQSSSGDEPPGRAEIIEWRQLYDFDPLPAALTPAERRHILGLQANLWTEHVRTTDYADRMLWPRAAIVAELAWSNPKKDWTAFSRRLVAAMERWRAMGQGFNVVPLEPLATFSDGGSVFTARLRQPAAIGTLRYTIDGTRPSARSPAYAQAISLKPGTVLTVQPFADATPLGASRRWLIGPALLRSRTASEMELCTNAIPLRLEDDGPLVGKRAVHWADIMHPCWIWRGAPLSGASHIVAEVGRMPFNFSIGDDIKKITFKPPATPAGELEVRRDGCEGTLIAIIPLQPATLTAGVAELRGPLAAESGAHDLCMTFTQRGPDPFWVLDRLTLRP